MKSQQTDSPVIVGTGYQLIVTGVIGSLCEQVVMVIITAHWQVAPSDVPKLQRLIVAGHEIALLVGVVVHTQDAIVGLVA